jgi:hypothetical protein
MVMSRDEWPAEFPPELGAARSIADVEALIGGPVNIHNEPYASLDLTSPLKGEEFAELGPEFFRGLMAEMARDRPAVPPSRTAQVFEHGLSLVELLREADAAGTAAVSERHRAVVDQLVELWKREVAEMLSA